MALSLARLAPIGFLGLVASRRTFPLSFLTIKAIAILFELQAASVFMQILPFGGESIFQLYAQRNKWSVSTKLWCVLQLTTPTLSWLGLWSSYSQIIYHYEAPK